MRSAVWVQDGGRTVTFDGNGPYYLGVLTSSLGATAETSRAPRQRGVTTWHTALDAPTINLTGSMWIFGDRSHPARAEYDRQRKLFHQIFAPHRWGVLTYRREDGPVQIRCRPVATPTITEPVGTYSTIDITFTADSPYWESAEEYVEAVGITQKFWHFPWAPYRQPMGAYNRYARIQNPTGELIYPRVEVYTTGQHITLTNQTAGQHVTIEHAIGEDQRLVVDLMDVTAYLYTGDGEGEDVSHWMSLDSEPWGLTPGENVIVISNDAPEDTPVTFLKYRIPYLGV